MTTLTLEWNVVVVEHHRIVIDPETDGVPVGFESLEKMYQAARVDIGTGTVKMNDVVTEGQIQVLRKFLADHEVLPADIPTAVSEDVDERYLTEIRITKPTKGTV